MESSLLADRVKEYIVEKEIARESSISASLKINPSRLNRIIGSLEREGFLQKRKELHRGHQVNTVVLVKTGLDGSAYKESIPSECIEPEEDLTVGTCKTMFASPCFFCPKLETCGEDNVMNYYNCPKLDDFISKKV